MSPNMNKVDWIVLLVDDDYDNLAVAEQFLEFNGAEVHTAKNGYEGLKILETVVPTFILLDLSMPDMDGWTMLGRIKANPSLVDIPVIALTAHAMTGDQDRVLAAGFDGYISKPFSVMTFIDDLKNIIKKE